MQKAKQIIGSLMIPILVYMVFLLLSFERFGNFSVLRAIIIQSFIPLLCAYGMVFGRSMKIMDLSIGSRMIASSMVGAILANNMGLGVGWMVVITVVVSLLLGAITGCVYYFFKIPSIVVSLAMATIIEFFGGIITSGFGFVEISKELAIFGGIPYNIILVIAATLVFIVIYYKTKFSFNVRAIGGNEIIARENGINSGYIKLLSYVVGSLFIGLAAVLQISYATSMSTKLNMESLSMSFKPLMAMIIGVQLKDRLTLPGGIFVGSFMLSTLFSGLVALGAPATAQDIALGVFLVAIISFSTNADRLSEWFSKKFKKSNEYS